MYGPSGPFLLEHSLCTRIWRCRAWFGSPAHQLTDSLAVGDRLKLGELLTPQGRNGVFGEPVQVQPLGLGALKALNVDLVFSIHDVPQFLCVPNA